MGSTVVHGGGPGPDRVRHLKSRQWLDGTLVDGTAADGTPSMGRCACASLGDLAGEHSGAHSAFTFVAARFRGNASDGVLPLESFGKGASAETLSEGGETLQLGRLPMGRCACASLGDLAEEPSGAHNAFTFVAARFS